MLVGACMHIHICRMRHALSAFVAFLFVNVTVNHKSWCLCLCACAMMQVASRFTLASSSATAAASACPLRRGMREDSRDSSPAPLRSRASESPRRASSVRRPSHLLRTAPSPFDSRRRTPAPVACSASRWERRPPWSCHISSCPACRPCTSGWFHGSGALPRRSSAWRRRAPSGA